MKFSVIRYEPTLRLQTLLDKFLVFRYFLLTEIKNGEGKLTRKLQWD